MTNKTEAQVFGAIGFLNEVMARYPQAISFAPGAPLLDGISRDRLIAAVDEFTGTATGWDALFQYGPSQGIINADLARVLTATAGLTVGASDITVTVGAQEAFLLILRALELHRSGTLGIVAPAFAGIRGAAAFVGARTTDVLEGPVGVEAEGLAAACAEAEARGEPLRALYVAPDFANPSGTVIPLRARRDLLRAAREREVLLIEDATYGFTDPDAPPCLKALDEHRVVIHVGTFAKVCLPGARVGYVVADQPWRGSTLATWLATLKNMTTVNTSPLSQAMVAGLVLSDPANLADRERQLAQIYRDKRNLLLAALDDEFPDAAALGLSWNRPTGGFFVVLQTQWELDHAALRYCAEHHGVLWTPMRDFYAGPHGDRALRLSCSHVQADQIRDGVRRLGGFLRAGPHREGSQ
ncbi:aminotransferase-like domain-containing protein [Mycobacterium paragordonae]|uniref:PLP-dependent aminotransferase family protein n=1 Tax=Mycobacterium paragordonae TaxID=1389713 RepID=A0AAJ1S9B4_9MYCO|nr:PLP-dependent aminotransferase family protein [Mycobacterium paragordonae]MDP7739605.1 PLP-dependent aminotransferase family protein [Mycobacterium paragordonae]